MTIPVSRARLVHEAAEAKTSYKLSRKIKIDDQNQKNTELV